MALFEWRKIDVIMDLHLYRQSPLILLAHDVTSVEILNDVLIVSTSASVLRTKLNHAAPTELVVNVFVQSPYVMSYKADLFVPF